MPYGLEVSDRVRAIDIVTLTPTGDEGTVLGFTTIGSSVVGSSAAIDVDWDGGRTEPLRPGFDGWEKI